MGANMGPSHSASASGRFSETVGRKSSSEKSIKHCHSMAQLDTISQPVRRNVDKCHDMSSRLVPKTRTSSGSTHPLSSSLTGLLVRAAGLRGRRGLALILAPIACTLLVLVAGGPQAQVAAHPEISATEQVAADTTRTALEAELNAILQAEQQQQDQDASSKLMSEAIISRLMLGNMSELGLTGAGNPGGVADLDGAPQTQNSATIAAEPAPRESTGGDDTGSPGGFADVSRLRRVLSLLQNYEMMQGDGGAVNGGQAFSQYPVLPASQAATIKRASMKMGNYLRAQQQSGQHAGQRQLASYGRVNSFDFGLGKRPDASVSGNILRFGDSASAGGHMAAVSGASGLGKRPSAHRYDFGLGKRVASPAYPRYDFGLGKRAPSRLRYDFGLGRRR